jgi:hypothetical protein
LLQEDQLQKISLPNYVKLHESLVALRELYPDASIAHADTYPESTSERQAREAAHSTIFSEIPECIGPDDETYSYYIRRPNPWHLSTNVTAGPFMRPHLNPSFCLPWESNVDRNIRLLQTFHHFDDDAATLTATLFFSNPEVLLAKFELLQPTMDMVQQVNTSPFHVFVVVTN